MSNRAFGVEIECYAPDGYENVYGDREDGIAYTFDLLKNNSYEAWALLVSEDESLSECGVEIKSPILDGAEGFKELKSVMNFLIRAGYSVENDCGFHVHLNAPEFVVNPKLSVKIVKAWMRNQHLINNMVDESRVSNDYCHPWEEEDLSSLESLVETYKTTDGTHRGSINVGSIPYHGSIEIRQHEGTLNYEEAEAWIKFCQAFVDSVSGSTIQKMSKEELLLKRLKVEKNASHFLTTKARIKRERLERLEARRTF